MTVFNLPPYEVGAIIIPTLQIRRLRDFKCHLQCHIFTQVGSWDTNQAYLSPKLMLFTPLAKAS